MKVQIEVAQGSLEWALLMLRRGKYITHPELYEGDGDLYYLLWDKVIELWEVEDNSTAYIDYRQLEDLPKMGYEIYDPTEHALKVATDKITDLELQLYAWQQRKAKLEKQDEHRADTKESTS